MAYGSKLSNKLPSRFPVGTKFVIEGRRVGEGQEGQAGQVQVFSRYLEFPDGTFFPLPAQPQRVPRKAARQRPRRRSARRRKA